MSYTINNKRVHCAIINDSKLVLEVCCKFEQYQSKPLADCLANGFQSNSFDRFCR